MRQKVLIIDDSPIITSLVQSRLVDEPIDFYIASTGEEGMIMATQLLPDLILLDIAMPHPDGFAVCRELKSRPDTMQIPIIFLTGVSSTEEKIRGLDLGAVDYVTKPFDSAELRARVRASLRTKYLFDLLAKKAQIDGLTGLWNRGYFDQRVISELSISRRTGTPLSCMMIDIDRFKQLNDDYGHPAGDEIIRRVGQAIVQCVRLEDIVCRYGGEEFIAVMPNTSCERACIVAERVRQLLINTPMEVHGQTIIVTASFGVTDAQPDIPATIRRADEALYRAKRGGRNRVECAATKASQNQSAPAA